MTQLHQPDTSLMTFRRERPTKKRDAVLHMPAVHAMARHYWERQHVERLMDKTIMEKQSSSIASAVKNAAVHITEHTSRHRVTDLGPGLHPGRVEGCQDWPLQRYSASLYALPQTADAATTLQTKLPALTQHPIRLPANPCQAAKARCLAHCIQLNHRLSAKLQ